jgi:type IV secretory pathway TraG/TraD family ATPase VirD4
MRTQLAHIYGEHSWQTFISNSGVIQYFGSRDKMTAEYFSALCGVTTIEVHNFSWAVGKVIGYATSFTHSQGGGSSTTSTSDSTSWTRTSGTSEAQRQLAYPDELMVLKGNQQVIFVENLDPIMAEKVLWYKDEGLRSLGVDLQAATPSLGTLYGGSSFLGSSGLLGAFGKGRSNPTPTPQTVTPPTPAAQTQPKAERTATPPPIARQYRREEVRPPQPTPSPTKTSNDHHHYNDTDYYDDV